MLEQAGAFRYSHYLAGNGRLPGIGVELWNIRSWGKDADPLLPEDHAGENAQTENDGESAGDLADLGHGALRIIPGDPLDSFRNPTSGLSESDADESLPARPERGSSPYRHSRLSEEP